MFLVNKRFFILLSMIGLFVSVEAFAALDPVSYRLIPASGLPAITQKNSAYALIYTLTNNLPFALPLGQIGKTIDGTGFSLNDWCSGKTLAASGGSCSIAILFQPADTGRHEIQLTLAYHNHRVPLPALSTSTRNGATEEIAAAVTAPLPASSNTGTGYPVEFTFTNSNTTETINAANIELTGDTSQLSNVQNNCLAALAPSKSCRISGTFTPSETGPAVIGATYQYANNAKSVALTSQTIASSHPGGCVSVSGNTALLLPVQTYAYADNVVKFIFTNHCETASASLATVDLKATLGSSTSADSGRLQNKRLKKIKPDAAVNRWITKGEDTCSGKTLAPNASCEVLASIIPEATGNNLVVNATVNYTQSGQSNQATAATTARQVLANSDTSRIITVVNQCRFPVWMSFVAAAAPGSPTPTCGNCPTGSVCNPSNNLCYWANPALDGKHPNGRLLAARANAAPDTMNIVISQNNAGSSPIQNIIYNAGIVARRNCTGTGSNLFCSENNCGGTIGPVAGSTDENGLCSPGTGVSTSPGISFNAVEFTFLRNRRDSGLVNDGVYDQQTINGVNVPMEIKGRGPSDVGSAPYGNCQPAGAIIQKTTGNPATQLGACSYDYQTPTTPTGVRASNYRFVTPVGNVSCENSDNQCQTPGEVCGLAYVDLGGNTGFKLTKRCGTLQGYVSVNTAICSQNAALFDSGISDLPDLYNCTTNYPSTNNALFTGAELYACTGAFAGKSCYNPDPSNPATSCCGCVNWWQAGLNVPTATQTCTSNDTLYSNPDWASPNGIVQPQIQWMKQACPTAYAYQYDDPSSSFQCTVVNESTDQIVTNYQVTFCPGGKSLPDQ